MWIELRFLFLLVSLSDVTVADGIFGFKSIAAYRSGLEINTNVSRQDAEEGLAEVLSGEFPIQQRYGCIRHIICLSIPFLSFFLFSSREACPHHK